ncbi:MAG: metallothionein [Verrucomicrobiales bacterium]|nr:metallothionein [Verrucomicrobiales bacterium]
MSNTIVTKCACPDCKCEVSLGHQVVKDGKEFCSEVCAVGHEDGCNCCSGPCNCGE